MTQAIFAKLITSEVVAKWKMTTQLKRKQCIISENIDNNIMPVEKSISVVISNISKLVEKEWKSKRIIL